jgi:hypothetical protein
MRLRNNVVWGFVDQELESQTLKQEKEEKYCFDAADSKKRQKGILNPNPHC